MGPWICTQQNLLCKLMSSFELYLFKGQWYMWGFPCTIMLNSKTKINQPIWSSLLSSIARFIWHLEKTKFATAKVIWVWSNMLRYRITLQHNQCYPWRMDGHTFIGFSVSLVFQIPESCAFILYWFMIRMILWKQFQSKVCVCLSLP